MSDTLKILIVDDDREIARGMSIRLRAAGYEVLTANDGQQGLAAALEHKPSAIILDIRMPVMDGLTMLAKLREDDRLAATPVIVLSANVAEHSRERALALGARYFLEKPYSKETLLAAIQSVLPSRQVVGVKST